MRETEEHARKLGFETAYLTTHDKQDFYGHVGYEYCQPVVSLGSASTILSEKMIERLFGNMSTSANDPHHSKHDVEKIKPRKNSECSPSVTAPLSLPPPAPLSPPPPAPLSPPPPAPLSPPAPPPPPALVSMPMADGLSSSGNIYWMKKSLVCL
ncbi:hypothetical protein LSAT2_022321 [Lamellibrachia satsuma]|nr:hypothetical protein LSAT2_022321 [Lamellibrachia satsuma]